LNKRPAVKRFAKITLQAGQSRTVNFKLRCEDLSFIGADNKPIVESGEFDVPIGGLKQRFTLK
jgi:beta-glucosidase